MFFCLRDSRAPTRAWFPDFFRAFALAHIGDRATARGEVERNEKSLQRTSGAFRFGLKTAAPEVNAMVIEFESS